MVQKVIIYKYVYKLNIGTEKLCILCLLTLTSQRISIKKDDFAKPMVTTFPTVVQKGGQKSD